MASAKLRVSAGSLADRGRGPGTSGWRMRAPVSEPQRSRQVTPLEAAGQALAFPNWGSAPPPYDEPRGGGALAGPPRAAASAMNGQTPLLFSGQSDHIFPGDWGRGGQVGRAELTPGALAEDPSGHLLPPRRLWEELRPLTRAPTALCHHLPGPHWVGHCEEGADAGSEHLARSAIANEAGEGGVISLL